MSPESTTGMNDDLDLQGQPPSNPDLTGLTGSTSNEDATASQPSPEEDIDSSEDGEDVDTSDKPNIMFVGKEEVTRIVDGKKETEMVPRIPPTHIQNGMQRIGLPKREVQQNGAFYHKDADTIVNLFPSLYKKYM